MFFFFLPTVMALPSMGADGAVAHELLLLLAARHGADARLLVIGLLLLLLLALLLFFFLCVYPPPLRGLGPVLSRVCREEVVLLPLLL